MKPRVQNRRSKRPGVAASPSPLLEERDGERRLFTRSRAKVRSVRLIARKRIEAYCEAIAKEFRPQKIVLFGSYAYGRPTPDSDVDLLVVLPFRGNDVTKAFEIRSRFDTPFPLDLLVRKPSFIATRLRERDMFIEFVMTK